MPKKIENKILQNEHKKKMCTINIRAQEFKIEDYEKAKDIVRALLNAGIWYFTVDRK